MGHLDHLQFLSARCDGGSIWMRKDSGICDPFLCINFIIEHGLNESVKTEVYLPFIVKMNRDS